METPSRITRSPVPQAQCNLAHAFRLVGDEWTLLILRSALYGLRRFDDFQADISIPRTLLAARLKRLVENGMLVRLAYREPGQRQRWEYHLTEMGQALRLPFLAMTEWGDRWLGKGPPPLVMTAKVTGKPLHVALVGPDGRAVPPEQQKPVFHLPKTDL